MEYVYINVITTGHNTINLVDNFHFKIKSSGLSLKISCTIGLPQITFKFLGAMTRLIGLYYKFKKLIVNCIIKHFIFYQLFQKKINFIIQV